MHGNDLLLTMLYFTAEAAQWLGNYWPLALGVLIVLFLFLIRRKK